MVTVYANKTLGGVTMKVWTQCKIVRPARGEGEAVTRSGITDSRNGQRPRRGGRVRMGGLLVCLGSIRKAGRSQEVRVTVI